MLDGGDRSTPPLVANVIRISPLRETEGQEQEDEPVAEADRSMTQDEDSSGEVPGALPIGLTLRDIQAKQEADPDIRVVKAWRENREQRPTKEERAPYHADVKYWCGRWNQLEIRDGVLWYH